jgi:hypothetical protein
MGKWKELAEPLDDRDAPTMKPIGEKLPNEDFIALLRDVLETNDRIVKSLTLPQLLLKGENNDKC